MIQIIALMALVLHGNTSATKGKRNFYSCQDEMPIYGTAHMARLQIEESSQLTERLSQCERAESNHVGLICIWLDCFYMASPLSHVFEGIRDRRGSASGSLALSINSRRFCTERQSQLSSSFSLYSFSLSLSLSLFAYCLFCSRFYH